KALETVAPLLELARDRAGLRLDAGHFVRGRRHRRLRARHGTLGVLKLLSRSLETPLQARPPVGVFAEIGWQELADLLAKPLGISVGLLEARLGARHRLVGGRHVAGRQ